jgi:hypothetical protein
MAAQPASAGGPHAEWLLGPGALWSPAPAAPPAGVVPLIAVRAPSGVLASMSTPPPSRPAPAASVSVATPPAPAPVHVPAPAPAPTPSPAEPATIPASPPLPPAPTGDGTVPLDATSADWLHRRAAEALAMITYPWDRLGYELVFDRARNGLRGQTSFDDRRIEIFVRPSDTVVQTAFDLAHEIAHAFDFARGGGPGRWAWMRARGLQSWDVWFGCSHCDDLATPAGDFAESFASWQVPAGRFNGRLGPAPTEAQKTLLAEITLLD